MADYRRKNPVIGGLLSFLFPGAGQFYNEEFGKGIILIAAAIAAIVSIVYTGISLGNGILNGEAIPEAVQIVKIVMSGLIYFGLWLFSMIDAVIRADRIGSGSAPAVEDHKAKTKEGVIGLGVVLIALGVIGILVQLGLKFEYLIKYGGPVALILFGGYLVAKTTGLIKGGK
jgi:TM2 domain-containing membrane protein YozV